MSNFKLTRGSTEIEFDAAILPITITRERSQNFVVTENDTVFVYDRGVTKQFYSIKFSVERNNNTFADIIAVRNFIENEANYRQNTFQLTPPDDIDLGEGDGIEVTVRYWGSQLIEEQGRTQIYEYNLRFKKVQ